MPTIKLENASWAVTVDESRRIVKNCSIMIDDGIVTEIDKAEKLRSLGAEHVIDGRDTVVTPGFVNCHMHINYSHIVRGIFPDDLPQQEYLRQVFRLKEEMTPEEEYYTSLLAVAELLLNGCTTILEPGLVNSLEDVVRAIEISGIRAVVGRSFFDRENPLTERVVDERAAARITESTIAEYDGKLGGRIRAWAMPFSPDYCSVESILRTKEIAESRRVGMTTHVANSEASSEAFRASHGLRPVEFLHKHGALSPSVLLSHCVSVDEHELDGIAAGHSKVVHCPSVAIRATGVTRVGKFPEMLERGIPVGLGSDAANSSYYLDPIRIMYLASVLFKEARGDRRIIPPETAVEMATINGARCILQGDAIGSIQVGKRADLTIMDTRRPEWRSLTNPLNNLVYSADGRCVRDVIVDGRIVVKNGRVTSFEVEEVLDKLQALGESFLERVRVNFGSRWPVL